MKWGIGLVLIAGVLLGVFQNCAQSNFESETASLDLSDSLHGGTINCKTDNCHDVVKKVEKTKYLSQLGNVEYVTSVFEQVFLSEQERETSDLEPAEIIIRDVILMNRSFFGGNCSLYDDKKYCIAHPNHNSNYAQMINNSFHTLSIEGSMNSSREGYRMQACDKLIADTNIMTQALENANLKPDSPLDFSNLQAFFQLFYPEIDEKEPVIELEKISASLDDRIFIKWKKIATVVCHSSGWQYY